jgi:nucleotide-binding universal stress UspA family protein
MYKRVLVPVDGSELSESILPLVLQVASASDLDVVLLNVNGFIPPAAVQARHPYGIHDYKPQLQEAASYLDRVARELRTRGVRVRTRVRGGNTVDAILAVAQDDAVDLIAMATHGRTGVARLFWGSVAERVVRQASVPVFLLRGHERDREGRRRDRTLHVTEAHR